MRGTSPSRGGPHVETPRVGNRSPAAHGGAGGIGRGGRAAQGRDGDRAPRRAGDHGPAGDPPPGPPAGPVPMAPPQITDLNSTRVIKRMFEGLTAQELGTYKIIPGLAQSWDISKDGLTYTFHLRPNVKFHDGTPLTAEAGQFCLDRPPNANERAYAP